MSRTRKLLAPLLAHPLARRIAERLHRTEVGRRLSQGVFWTLIGNATWRFLTAVSTITVARILGPQGYGEFGMIQSTIRMISIYASFGLGPTSTKYVAEFRRRDPQRAASILHLTLTIALFLCTSVSVVLLAGSTFFAGFFLERPALATGLSIGAVMLFFMVYAETKQQALLGFEAFRAIARISIIRGVLTPLLCIPLAFYWGAEGALAGLALVAVVTLVNCTSALRRERREAGFPPTTRLKTSRAELPVLWRYALPGVLAGIVITAMTWAGRLLLVRQEDGYAQLGLFEAAFQWQAVVLFLPGVFLKVVFPILSETFAREEKGEFNTALSLQAQAVLLVTLPLTVLAIGFSGPIAALFGSSFRGAGDVISVLMLSVFFNSLTTVMQSVYDGTGRRWTNLGMYLAWAAVYGVCGMSFIPGNGAMGFACTHLAADVVLLLLTSTYIDLVIAPATLRRHLNLLLLSVALLLSCYLVQDMMSGYAAILLYCLLFLASMWPAANKLGLVRR